MRIVLLIILAFIFQSCSSFKSNDFSILNESNISMLNGTYSIESKEFKKKHKRFEYYNLLRKIDRKLIRDTLHIDSSKNHQLGITILNKKKVLFSYIEDDKVYRKRILKAKFKKDGYLYLKNKNFNTVLIPFLFGQFNFKRSRIGVNKEHDLIFEVCESKGGAALFFIELYLDTRRYRNTYAKIE